MTTWDQPLDEDSDTALDTTNIQPGQWQEWLGDQGYDPTKFYPGNARNEAGLRERVTVSMGPTLYDLVMRVGMDRDLPYHSAASFIRDSIIHRLWWLDQIAPSEDRVRNYLAGERSQQRMLDDLDSIQRMVEIFETFVEKMETAFTSASRYGDWSVLVESIGRHEEFWADMRDPYRSRALALLASYRDKVPVHWDPNDYI